MKIEDVVDRFEKDSAFGDDMGAELLRIPELHNRYFRLLIKVKRKLSEINEEYDAKKHIKSLYYLGQASPETYKEQPFNERVTKAELPMWLAADRDLKKLRREREGAEQYKEAMTEIVKQINERKWIIKSYLENEVIKLGIRG